MFSQLHLWSVTQTFIIIYLNIYQSIKSAHTRNTVNIPDTVTNTITISGNQLSTAFSRHFLSEREDMLNKQQKKGGHLQLAQMQTLSFEHVPHYFILNNILPDVWNANSPLKYFIQLAFIQKLRVSCFLRLQFYSDLLNKYRAKYTF